MNLLSNLITIGLLTSIIFGAIYARLWFNDRKQWAYLYFACSAFSVAAFAISELLSIHAGSIDEFVRARHWAHISGWFITVSFALFIFSYLQAGLLWLFGVATAFRLAAVIIDQFSPYSINFSNISALQPVRVFGETITQPVATANPMMIVSQIGLIIYLVFCAHAAISVWNRGDKRLALTMGGSVVLFSSGALITAVLVNWHLVDLPLLVTPFFIGILSVMGYELTWRVISAHKLSTELEEKNLEAARRREALNVASEAGNVGVWVRDFRNDSMIVNKRWRSIFEFDDEDTISFESFVERIHPDDRESILKTLHDAVSNIGWYDSEYRIVCPDQQIKWISSKGKVEKDANDWPVIYGASADVTTLKRAEIAAHDLSGRLIGAQESERSRLARELHDDLSQNLALISIQIDTISKDGNDAEVLQSKLELLSDRIRGISADVHRISHSLHPALLHQVGLIASMRGFCREIATSRGIKVDLETDDLAEEPSPDIALCLFRVMQEALQNAAKHSESSFANVELRVSNGVIVLSIADGGKGFDPTAQIVQDSLGLVSMKERLRAVHGTLRIDSEPGRGSRITATVPFQHNP